jgi:hypothetical protein
MWCEEVIDILYLFFLSSFRPSISLFFYQRRPGEYDLRAGLGHGHNLLRVVATVRGRPVDRDIRAGLSGISPLRAAALRYRSQAIRFHLLGTVRDVGQEAHCALRNPPLGSSFVTLTSHVRQAAVSWPAETDSLTVVRLT